MKSLVKDVLIPLISVILLGILTIFAFNHLGIILGFLVSVILLMILVHFLENKIYKENK